MIAGVPHCATEDTTIQGFNIPKGTTIISNLWAVNHDPNLWKDPEEFRPERFLNEEGAVIQPAYLIPFGTGQFVIVVVPFSEVHNPVGLQQKQNNRVNGEQE